MALERISLRTRLAVGLGVVAAVFAAAVLVMLHELAQLHGASNEVIVRLEVRRQVLDAVRVAEKLQHDFVSARLTDPRVVQDFRRLYDELDGNLRSLLQRSPKDRERVLLVQLRGATNRLGMLLMRGAPQAMHDGAAADYDAATLVEQSRAVLTEIDDLNSRLIEVFDTRILQAAEQAQAAWAIGSAISQAIFPAALLVCLLVIYYTHRSVAAPVRDLVKGTRQLAQRGLSGEVRVGGAGEFQTLAESFNRMATQLRSKQRQLIESERMASVGRIAAGVAHEINNPITVIIGHARMLLAETQDGAPEAEALQTIAEEAMQCRNIVNSLLDLSRPSEASPAEVINPNGVLAEVMNMAQALQLGERVETDVSVTDQSLPLSISRSRLRQLTLNIVRNALEALDGLTDARLTVKGYVRPRAKLPTSWLKEASSEPSSFLILAFSDNGPGIAPEAVERLFEPFFTTRPEGTGLGLAISYNIAHAHGGFINVDSRPGRGTTFTVGIPLVDSA